MKLKDVKFVTGGYHDIKCIRYQGRTLYEKKTKGWNIKTPKLYEIDANPYFEIKRRYDSGEEIDVNEFQDFIHKFGIDTGGGELCYIPENVDVFNEDNYFEVQGYAFGWEDFDITWFKNGKLYINTRSIWDVEGFLLGTRKFELFLYVGNGVFEVYKVSAKDIKYVK